ncbi:hypothetical protein ACFL0A_01790 [Patescibacteria group bacterium]
MGEMTLKEALEKTEKGEKFSVVVVTPEEKEGGRHAGHKVRGFIIEK